MSPLDRFCAWLLDLIIEAAAKLAAWYVFIPAGQEATA